MVQPAYDNLALEFWVYRGKVGLVESTLCLFHAEKRTGAPLLDALKGLKEGPCPAKCALTFRACQRKRALRALKLRYVPVREELKVMNLRHEAEWGTFEMTSDGLALMTEAVASWLAGAEDFGVSSRHSSLERKQLGRLDRESGELWFWGPVYYAP